MYQVKHYFGPVKKHRRQYDKAFHITTASPTKHRSSAKRQRNAYTGREGRAQDMEMMTIEARGKSTRFSSDTRHEDDRSCSKMLIFAVRTNINCGLDMYYLVYYDRWKSDIEWTVVRKIVPVLQRESVYGSQ